MITIITVAPGHFHAALVQKFMYKSVDNTFFVFAPEGPEVQDYLARIESYNSRIEDPTNWEANIYTGKDFFQKMLDQKPGNLVTLAGNNRNKTKYIYECINNGLNVLSDKPMAIDSSGFTLLREAFSLAEKKGVLLYDIMTERFEITTIMQKAFSQQEKKFGKLRSGSIEEPAITKESIHHFKKTISGIPLQRPPWFFDVEQEGEAIADVGTHLVDLIQWEVFPEETIDYKLKGVFAHISVEWKYEAPEGAGDTHFSIMRGTLSDLIIIQGKDEEYKPTLYIKSVDNKNRKFLEENIAHFNNTTLKEQYPGIIAERIDTGYWRLNIPDKYRIGHEAHFAQVTRQFLKYLEKGQIPEWEVANMLAKYYTTTMAVSMSK